MVLTFGQLAGTLMACPKTDEIAKRFRAALKGTSHWSIVKERLEFLRRDACWLPAWRASRSIRTSC